MQAMAAVVEELQHTANGEARADRKVKEPKVTTQPLPSPPLCIAHQSSLKAQSSVSSLQERIQMAEQRWHCARMPDRLRMCVQFWEKHARLEVLNLILKGVPPDKPLPVCLSLKVQDKSLEENQLAREVLQDYESSGAVKRVFDEKNTGHLVPWFVLVKKEGENVKKRFITDCRELNGYFTPRKFKLDHIGHIFPYLSKGQWAAKIDLKDAYFHLALGDALKRFLRVQVQSDVWEFQAACFGISTLPQAFMAVMKTLEKICRSKGILCFVYLDDILLLGSSRTQVSNHLEILTSSLLEGGFKINVKKSILEPVQSLTHLGFVLNLKQGLLQVPIPKLKTIRRELGKLLLAKQLSCRKMASILGQVRAYLPAIPPLRLVTDTLAEFAARAQVMGWDHTIPIPQEVKDQVRELKEFLLPDKGRPFVGPTTSTLHSDSSTHALGA